LIVLYHLNHKVVQVTVDGSQTYSFDSTISISKCLHVLAQEFPDKNIFWCHFSHKENLNVEELPNYFHHAKMLLSFSTQKSNYFGRLIGYVEESIYIQVNKKVSFATWQMSSEVGLVHASVLNAIRGAIHFDANFDYYLSSLAKLAMPLGLFCYSEPRLLKIAVPVVASQANMYSLFRFVKQHYKSRWVFLLFFNLMVYEKRFALLPMLFSLGFKKRTNDKMSLEAIEICSSRKVVHSGTLDVIIPTIGRKDYLYAVLRDFAQQSHLPDKIIIVEQNPVEDSTTELDYITTEKWPFLIQHLFIHQAGACNARNLALAQTESEWVFLADDDNRFDSDLIQMVFEQIKKYGNAVVTTAYPQQNEIKKYKKVIQWSAFGAGNSFVKKSLLDQVCFTKALEFGYGEDSDFGMQLRNLGHDILYFPEPEILHLKAPIGGFRTKPVLRWQGDAIQPKPSPTVLFYILTHNTKEQLCCYKTNLFIKYYSRQAIKNPFRYYALFQKQWQQSRYWANELKKEG
jgi:glycosyltransferase involved in cell wall biosynthesis